MNKEKFFFFAKRIKTTIADPREKKLYSLIGFSAKAHQTNHVIIRRCWSSTVGHWLDLSI
jgi:hypothetical protein